MPDSKRHINPDVDTIGAALCAMRDESDRRGHFDEACSALEALSRLIEQLEAARLVMARQLTPLDVAATHIDIIRRKGDEYAAQERDNVAAIVESHVKEARAALFAAIDSNPASIQDKQDG